MVQQVFLVSDFASVGCASVHTLTTQWGEGTSSWIHSTRPEEWNNPGGDFEAAPIGARSMSSPAPPASLAVFPLNVERMRNILPPESDSTVKLMAEKPNVSYKDIGGMDVQKQEVREAIELPLIQHHLYQQIGIDPPRGVLLYGTCSQHLFFTYFWYNR